MGMIISVNPESTCIVNMCIYFLFEKLLLINLCKVQSMDDIGGEWVECMGVASRCGYQEVGVASGSG